MSTTILTGTFIDTDNVPWANSVWIARLILPLNATRAVFTADNSPVPPSYTGVLDDDGNPLSDAVVGDTSSMTPPGCLWQFTIYTNTSADPVTMQPVAVVGPSYTVAKVKFDPLRIPVIRNAAVYAYSSVELTGIDETGADPAPGPYTWVNTNRVPSIWIWYGDVWVELLGEDVVPGLTSFQGRTTAAAVLLASDIEAILAADPYDITIANSKDYAGLGQGLMVASSAGNGILNAQRFWSVDATGILRGVTAAAAVNVTIDPATGTITSQGELQAAHAIRSFGFQPPLDVSRSYAMLSGGTNGVTPNLCLVQATAAVNERVWNISAKPDSGDGATFELNVEDDNGNATAFFICRRHGLIPSGVEITPPLTIDDSLTATKGGQLGIITAAPLNTGQFVVHGSEVGWTTLDTGSAFGWNVDGGNARTAIVNVDPRPSGGTPAGFVFYAVKSDTVMDATTPFIMFIASNGDLYVSGDLHVTGNITAANYPPPNPLQSGTVIAPATGNDFTTAAVVFPTPYAATPKSVRHTHQLSAHLQYAHDLLRRQRDHRRIYRRNRLRRPDRWWGCYRR